jgi:hypothetical protein
MFFSNFFDNYGNIFMLVLLGIVRCYEFTTKRDARLDFGNQYIMIGLEIKNMT